MHEGLITNIRANPSHDLTSVEWSNPRDKSTHSSVIRVPCRAGAPLSISKPLTKPFCSPKPAAMNPTWHEYGHDIEGAEQIPWCWPWKQMIFMWRRQDYWWVPINTARQGSRRTSHFIEKFLSRLVRLIESLINHGTPTVRQCSASLVKRRA